MFTEVKTLKVDNYALKNQIKDILAAITKLADEKIIHMRKTYCPKSLYRCEQNFKDTTKIANKYDIEFYNYETNETLGGLRIIIKNIDDKENSEGNE